jgi:hypothetical protein
LSVVALQTPFPNRVQIKGLKLNLKIYDCGRLEEGVCIPTTPRKSALGERRSAAHRCGPLFRVAAGAGRSEADNHPRCRRSIRCLWLARQWVMESGDYEKEALRELCDEAALRCGSLRDP